MLEPSLLVDDHQGIYMMELLVKENEKNNTPFFKQLKKYLDNDELNSLKDAENEFHCETCDKVTTLTFRTQTGQAYTVQYAEGGIWAIPACYARNSKKMDEFFQS